VVYTATIYSYMHISKTKRGRRTMYAYAN